MIVVGLMSGEEPYIEHIESTEIKKLIDRIYKSKPEDVIAQDVPLHHHDDIVEQIDDLLIKPKESSDKRSMVGRRL